MRMRGLEPPQCSTPTIRACRGRPHSERGMVGARRRRRRWWVRARQGLAHRESPNVTRLEEDAGRRASISARRMPAHRGRVEHACDELQAAGGPATNCEAASRTDAELPVLQGVGGAQARPCSSDGRAKRNMARLVQRVPQRAATQVSNRDRWAGSSVPVTPDRRSSNALSRCGRARLDLGRRSRAAARRADPGAPPHVAATTTVWARIGHGGV